MHKMESIISIRCDRPNHNDQNIMNEANPTICRLGHKQTKKTKKNAFVISRTKRNGDEYKVVCSKLGPCFFSVLDSGEHGCKLLYKKCQFKKHI